MTSDRDRNVASKREFSLEDEKRMVEKHDVPENGGATDKSMPRAADEGKDEEHRILGAESEGLA